MRATRTTGIAGLAALGGGYFAAASLAIAATRFDGGVAFLWVATAVLVARLATIDRRQWPAATAVCFATGALATTLFGFGGAAAIPLAVVNVTEAVLGALMLRRFNGSTDPFQSLDWLFGFILALGIVAPAVGALGAGAITTLLYGKPFWANVAHWFTGHSLGTLTFAPIAMMVMRGDFARWREEAVPARLGEVAVLLALVVATGVVVFAQSAMPLLFMPMLPIILATFRAGRLAAAVSLVILAAIGGAFTLANRGPVSLMAGGVGAHMQFLQFYLAASMLTILPVAAELQRRAVLFRRLRDSEARYRLVTDNSTDIVLNLDVDGCIRFLSPSIRHYGYDPQAMIGRAATDLVAPEYLTLVTRAHVNALRAPAETFIVEYEVLVGSDERRWFETHTRAVLDEKGRVAGVVSAARDITHRKAVEARLELAAMTDPLTGLANRRAFMGALDLHVAGGTGCVAMFDLDHFKRVNDSYGHEAGDRVLEQFAVLARATVREGDLVARLGGEEFAVILPGLRAAQAHQVCDRLRREVARQPFALGGLHVAVTVSGGVAEYDPSGSRQAVLRDADAALYRAKAEGRDRLAIAA